MDYFFEQLNFVDINIILLFIVLLLAHIAEAVTGFGSTILSVALGANLYPLDKLLPTIIPLNFFLSLYIVLRHRRYLDFGILFKKIIPFFIIGMPLGILIFNLGAGSMLNLIFGFFVIILTGVEFMRLRNSYRQFESRPLPTIWGALCLITGGIVHGLYASGGPLVVYYANRQISDKKVFRSTVSGLWLLMSVVLIINYYIAGKITPITLQNILILIPSLILGILIGELVHERINERIFRVLIYIFLFIAGLSLIIDA